MSYVLKFIIFVFIYMAFVFVFTVFTLGTKLKESNKRVPHGVGSPQLISALDAILNRGSYARKEADELGIKLRLYAILWSLIPLFIIAGAYLMYSYLNRI